MSSPYRKPIEDSLRRQGLETSLPTNLIEAWMRVEHPTLDGLDRKRFDEEVRLGLEAVKQEPELSRELAASMGL